jgi:hypothetical protein
MAFLSVLIAADGRRCAINALDRCRVNLSAGDVVRFTR